MAVFVQNMSWLFESISLMQELRLHSQDTKNKTDCCFLFLLHKHSLPFFSCGYFFSLWTEKKDIYTINYQIVGMMQHHLRSYCSAYSQVSLAWCHCTRLFILDGAGRVFGPSLIKKKPLYLFENFFQPAAYVSLNLKIYLSKFYLITVSMFCLILHIWKCNLMLNCTDVYKCFFLRVYLI